MHATPAARSCPIVELSFARRLEFVREWPGRPEKDYALRHGGGVKLLLRCLQSIQCQYYLVFGVVKTVLCSLSRDYASRSVLLPLPLSPLRRPGSHSIASFFRECAFATQRLNNDMANGHRYIYILHLLSLRSSLIVYLHGACARAHSSTFPLSGRAQRAYCRDQLTIKLPNEHATDYYARCISKISSYHLDGRFCLIALCDDSARSPGIIPRTSSIARDRRLNIVSLR